MLKALLFTLHDANAVRDTAIEAQTIMMHSVVGSDPAAPNFGWLKLKQILPQDDDEADADVCTWTIVKCRKGIVTEFAWNTFRPHVKLYLAWFPSTVESIYIVNAKLKTNLDTRRLPRSLTYCSMIHNGLRGSIELRTLPPRIKRLVLSRNALTGVLYIADLPKSLLSIKLGDTKFHAVYVTNGDLPERLREIQVFRYKGTCKFYCVDDQTIDKRIHTGPYLGKMKQRRYSFLEQNN